MITVFWVLFFDRIAAHENAVVDDGGWNTGNEERHGYAGPCNIERHDGEGLSQAEFLHRYAYAEPVILTGADNEEFRRLCAKDYLLAQWGEKPVTLNSANTYSYKRVESTLSTYVENHLRPQDHQLRGNETLYLFGDIDQTIWRPLLDAYNQPKWTVPGHQAALSFGLAGAGTGVPFHFHGPGFAEVIYGAKRWFLYPYEKRPAFDPDNTTLNWYLTAYRELERESMPLECLLRPGEVIYFPDKWWHATLNVETSVFISTFLSP